MSFAARRRLLRESQTRDWVRCVVRSGLLSSEEMRAQFVTAIATDLPSLQDPRAIAERWLTEERASWAQEAQTWPPMTDFERIEASFAELRERGYLVLEGCVDHWAARDALAANPSARGVLWFVPADVWHAVDQPMLEVNLWHPSTANAAADDDLTHEVLGILAEHGLQAVFDEGRIEVAARWQRRPQ